MVSADEKHEFVEKHAHWHYEYDLGDGVVTVPFSDDIQAWHQTRKRIILREIERSLGGDFGGLSCLDVACNSGFWSFALAEKDVRPIFGLDQSLQAIEQAKFIQRCWADRPGVSSIQFQHRNIFELRQERTYDIVLCLGLMYHLTDPLTVARALFKLTNRLLVVDSATILGDGEFFEIGDHEKHPGISKREFSFVPSKGALKAIFRHAGFEKIEEYKPESPKDWAYYENIRTLLLLSK